MTITRFSFTMLLGCCFAIGPVQFSLAQILDAPSQTPPTQSTIPQPTTPAQVQQAGTVADELANVEQTSWSGFALPKITMPKLWPSTVDDRPALLSPFVSGATKVSDGAKKAWEGTKDIFSVGASSETSATRAPSAPPQPSFWQKLIGRAPQKEFDDGPQTVGELMSQKRLLP